MANQLLGADTATYVSLLGDGDLFLVPPYQRDYSWTEEQWEDLWEDILSIHESDSGEHYLGAIVLKRENGRQYEVIDGQQRLATVSLLSIAIIQRLYELADAGIDSRNNKERGDTLHDTFIGKKDPASLQRQSRLQLNDTDKSVYRDYIVQYKKPQSTYRLSKSNKLLIDGLTFFCKRISEQTELFNDGVALANFLDKTIARKLAFIKITVQDEASAYTVFETLNARGIALSTTDLIKNLLFSKTPEVDFDSLKDRWGKLLSLVGAEKFPEFLRYHLLCKHRSVRSEKLFKMIRSEISTGQDVSELIDELEPRAELYAALVDPNHEWWDDQRAIRNHLRELKLFRLKQFMPVAFAAHEKFTIQQFESVLRILVVHSFRYTVVSTLNTRDLEPMYSEISQGILSGALQNPKAVFTKLQEIYVDDDRFKQSFSKMVSEASGQRKAITKYILLKIDNKITGGERDFETDPATIEHILPENQSQEWDSFFSAEQAKQYANRLGNLTLLTASQNRSIGNSPFKRKLSEYSASKYAITSDIPAKYPEDWTTNVIEQRQSDLASFAVQIWRWDA